MVAAVSGYLNAIDTLQREGLEAGERERRATGIRDMGQERALRAGDTSTAMRIDPDKGVPARVIERAGWRINNERYRNRNSKRR